MEREDVLLDDKRRGEVRCVEDRSVVAEEYVVVVDGVHAAVGGADAIPVGDIATEGFDALVVVPLVAIKLLLQFFDLLQLPSQLPTNPLKLLLQSIPLRLHPFPLPLFTTALALQHTTTGPELLHLLPQEHRLIRLNLHLMSQLLNLSAIPHRVALQYGDLLVEFVDLFLFLFLLALALGEFVGDALELLGGLLFEVLAVLLELRDRLLELLDAGGELRLQLLQL